MQVQRKDKVSAGVAVTESFDLQDGQRLVSVELVETDSSGNAVYDIGIIAISYPGAAGFDLKIGHMGIGSSLVWSGDIPVYQPMKLVVSFAYPANGNLCSIRYCLANENESPGLGGKGSTNVVQVYPLGKPRLIYLDGTSDVLTKAFQPPANFQWLVCELSALHDDGTSRSIRWNIYDGTNTDLGDYTGALAAGAKSYFSDGVTANLHFKSLAQPLFTNLIYPIAEVAALSSGKKLYVRGFVLEFAGGN